MSTWFENLDLRLVGIGVVAGAALVLLLFFLA